MIRSFKPDPLGIPRNPFHVFLFVIAFLNGLVLSWGVPTSSAIDDSLPELLMRSYGVLLALGSLCVLVGMFWMSAPRDGLLIKRIGYLGLSFATMIYSGAVINVNRTPGGILASTTTLVFAGICLWQVHEINLVVKTSIKYGSNHETG